MLKASTFFLLISGTALGWTSPARARPAEDATVTVTGVLDKFNDGDIEAFAAVHRAPTPEH